MGRGFRILSDRSGTVRESQSPLVKFRNKAFTGGTSLLPEALFNADSLRKAQDPVIFLRCHCAIECFNICHLRKRCILIHNANIDMIPIGSRSRKSKDTAWLPHRNDVRLLHGICRNVRHRIAYPFPTLKEIAEDDARSGIKSLFLRQLSKNSHLWIPYK